MKTKKVILDFSNKVEWVRLILSEFGVLFVLIVIALSAEWMMQTVTSETFIRLFLYASVGLLSGVYLHLTECRNSYIVYDDCLIIREYRLPWIMKKTIIPIQSITFVEIKRTWLHPKAYLWITISGEQHVLKAVTHRDDLYHYIQQQIQLSQKS